jgi:hypothetical protein
MSTSGQSPSTVEQNATRQSGDNSPDDKSPDAEKNITTLNQQRDSPTIQVTLRPTTNYAYMEDQQVLSHNSTERPTATYASTVHQQVMSQNTTTSPNSNVPVGKKKKGKIPDEQGLCGKKISSGSQEKTSDEQELHNSEGKSESKGKIPVKQVLQDNESSSESEENPSNEQELLGCQGKSESEGKIPDKRGLQGEKNSSESKEKISNEHESLNKENSESEGDIMGNEKPDYVQREDSVPEGIVNE